MAHAVKLQRWEFPPFSANWEFRLERRQPPCLWRNADKVN